MIAFLALIASIATLSGLLSYQWQRADRLAAMNAELEALVANMHAEVAQRNRQINDLLLYLDARCHLEQAAAVEAATCDCEHRVGVCRSDLLRWN